MLSASEERLNSLWLKAMAVHDPAERESLLWEFRDALHEHIDQRGKETPGSFRHHFLQWDPSSAQRSFWSLMVLIVRLMVFAKSSQ
jgi:hypothetical protein